MSLALRKCDALGLPQSGPRGSLLRVLEVPVKRAILGVVAVVALAACTPSQGARYLEAWFSGHQAEATAAVADYEAVKADATAGRPCAQWYDIAIEAGFTPEQWKEPVSRIMYRESHCNPMADNPTSTARGLMQELRMWADDCGGTYEDLHDPVFNINCAAHIYEVQGWRAWATY